MQKNEDKNLGVNIVGLLKMADITLERNTYNACMHLKRRVVYEHEREEKGEHGYI